MKQTYNILFLFLLLMISGGIYYSKTKTHTLQFDKHIVDAVHASKINPFFEKADALKYTQDYLQAQKEFENLLPQAKNSDDNIYIFNQLAYIALAMNEDSLAQQYIQQLETHFPKIDKSNPDVLSDYFYNKGTLSYRLMRPKESEFFLKKSLDNIQKAYPDDHLKKAQCLATLGLMLCEFAPSPDSAFLYLPMADTVFKKNKEILSAWSPECLLGMSIISSYKRRYDEATGYCEEAISILNKQPFVNNVLTARCLVYKARAINARALKAEKIEDKQRISNEVAAYYKKAVEICPKNSLHLQECYHYWARQYARIDSISDPNNDQHFWQTLAALEKTIQIQGKQRFSYPDLLKGFYYQKKNKIDSAIIYQTQFLNSILPDSTGFPSLIIGSSAVLSHLYEILADKQKNARWFIDSSLHYMKINTIKYAGFNDLNMTWYEIIKPEFYNRTALQFVALSYEAGLFYKKYQLSGDKLSLDLSTKLAKITDNLLNTHLTSLDDDAFDFFQSEAAKVLYSNAIQASVIRYEQTKDETYLNDIFHFGERVRSFLLYRDADTRDSTAILPRQSLKDSIRQIEGTINKLKLATERGQPANIDLMQQQNRREMLFTQLKNEYPSYFKLKIEQPIPDIKTVQADLKPEQWFVQYTFSDSLLNMLFISQKDIYLHQTIWNDSMEHQLKLFCNYFINEKQTNTLTPEAYARLGYEIYKKLLPNFPAQYQSAFANCQELIVSPDGTLNLLPFEALVESGNGANYKTLDYLVHCYPITYAPSWKIYSINKKIQMPAQPKLKVYTYAIESNELPSAKAEMENITRIFNKNAFFSVGQNCSKNAFNSDNESGYDILHLSLHAESDGQSKYNNKIYFAPRHQDTVYGFDLLNRRFNEKLVVLSACQSAYGITKKGEGTYALSRIFLRAGVPRVIASLWSINDTRTAQITTSFYENLVLKQLSTTTSLQKAKQKYIQFADSFTAQPRFWAGLVCID